MYWYGRSRSLVSLSETHLAARDLANLTETKGKLAKTWPKDETDSLLGRDDRDHENLADSRLIPGKLGRRPTAINVNAQTKVSEVNPSLRIR